MRVGEGGREGKGVANDLRVRMESPMRRESLGVLTAAPRVAGRDGLAYPTTNLVAGARSLGRAAG